MYSGCLKTSQTVLFMPAIHAMSFIIRPKGLIYYRCWCPGELCGISNTHIDVFIVLHTGKLSLKLLNQDKILYHSMRRTMAEMFFVKINTTVGIFFLMQMHHVIWQLKKILHCTKKSLNFLITSVNSTLTVFYHQHTDSAGDWWLTWCSLACATGSSSSEVMTEASHNWSGPETHRTFTKRQNLFLSNNTLNLNVSTLKTSAKPVELIHFFIFKECDWQFRM